MEFLKIIEQKDEEDRIEILQIEKTHDIIRRGIDYAVGYAALLDITMYEDEIANCIAVGYILIATCRTSEVTSEVIEINDVDDYRFYLNLFDKWFRPRYIRYKNIVHIHIERFKPGTRFKTRQYVWKTNVLDIHRMLYDQGRMTKAKYDRLVRLEYKSKL